LRRNDNLEIDFTSVVAEANQHGFIPQRPDGGGITIVVDRPSPPPRR
jgi:hypothetical protein